MRSTEDIIRELSIIYKESRNDAEEYLCKARQLKTKYGSGLATVYCWFYSIPQKWTQVEPAIFKLMKYTKSFDLKSVIAIPREDLAAQLKSIVYHNEISQQLKNFCRAIVIEYGNWREFTDELENEDIFLIFKRLRNHRSVRITFKNLAAMKAFIGSSNDFFILDTHFGKVMGIEKEDASKCRVQEKLYKDLSTHTNEITHELERRGFDEITTIKWSLAIWFNKVKIRANDLLPEVPSHN